MGVYCCRKPETSKDDVNFNTSDEKDVFKDSGNIKMKNNTPHNPSMISSPIKTAKAGGVLEDERIEGKDTKDDGNFTLDGGDNVMPRVTHEEDNIKIINTEVLDSIVTTFEKDFCQRLFEEFNECRTNPKEYANKVMKHMQYIKVNDNNNYTHLPGSAYVYENPLLKGPKILLAEGWAKISEFVQLLKIMKPLRPLTYNSQLCLKIPKDKSDWTNRDVFLKLIAEKKKELKLPKLCFHFDVGYEDAETSAVLQLVDDNTGFNGSRRKNILNPDVTHVGIFNQTLGIKNCTYVLFIREVDETKPDESNNLSYI